MVTRLRLTSVAVFLFPYVCFADFSGPVISVLDGDTIEVLHNQRPERIRLSGIDCKLPPTVTDSNENLSGTVVARKNVRQKICVRSTRQRFYP